MAGSRGLNARAPAYIPLSYTTQTPFTNFPPPPLHIHHFHHFPFSSPPPLPPSFFPTASKSPLLQSQSPLHSTPYTIHPPAPPPPRVVEPPKSVGPETVRIGAPRRRPSTTSGFRSSSQHHQKEPNFRASSSSRNRERWRRGSMLKKYEVLPLSHCEEKTTVMIKNIPKLFNGKMLLKFLDEQCLLENQKRKENSEEEEDDTVSAFNFMYLPIDFSTGRSRGFAFVNFTEARAVWKFLRACNRKTWDLFQQYPKTREIVCARIQVSMAELLWSLTRLQSHIGKEALVKHFAKSKFHCESDEFLPVCFSPPRDGSGTELVEETRIGKRMAPTTPNV